MAGHSKWANIKHRKGAADARRSKLFSKLVKEIMVAARVGGPIPETNPRLRMAIQNAKGVSVPKDNIERAINKGAGSTEGNYTDITYEGYGPSGVALIIECTTDNLNRTIANIRTYFNKTGGSLSTTGSMDFIFERKGVFTFNSPEVSDKESFILELIDGGAEEVEEEAGKMTVYSAFDDFGNVQKKLEAMQIEPENSGTEYLPNIFKKVNKEDAPKMAKLLENLENDEDVKSVYHNMEFSDEIAAYFE